MDNYLYNDLNFADIIGNPEIRDTPDGMYAAARCYLNGKGVKANYVAYLDYLEQAASIGSQRAKEEMEEIEERTQQEAEENLLNEKDTKWDSFQDNQDADSDFSISESPTYENSTDNVEVFPLSTESLRYTGITEGLTVVKKMSTIDLYEEAADGNPYACLEIYYRTQNGENRDQELATQCLDEAVSVAEQWDNSEFCKIVFKEAGEYYADKDLSKSLDYLGKASELGDTSASLHLARHYLTEAKTTRKKENKEQAIRYLELSGSGKTNEDTYELGKAYIECGLPLKGKSLLGRLLKQENLDQNLWFQCAQLCPEFITPEEINSHAWNAKDFTPDIQTYLLNYYEQNPDSVDLNPERIFLLAKWERDINGSSGPWMQRAADQGVAEAIDILNQEKQEKAREEALILEKQTQEKKEQAKRNRREKLGKYKSLSASFCMLFLIIVFGLSFGSIQRWWIWLLDIVLIVGSVYLCYDYLGHYSMSTLFRIITTTWFIILAIIILRELFTSGLSFMTYLVRLVTLILSISWAILRHKNLTDNIAEFWNSFQQKFNS